MRNDLDPAPSPKPSEPARSASEAEVPAAGTERKGEKTGAREVSLTEPPHGSHLPVTASGRNGIPRLAPREDAIVDLELVNALRDESP